MLLGKFTVMGSDNMGGELTDNNVAISSVLANLILKYEKQVIGLVPVVTKSELRLYN
jgi:hypothetical protein